VKVVLLDYPPYGPWDVEAAAALAAGAAFEVASYEAFSRSPQAADLILNAGAWPLSPELLDGVAGCRCVVGYGVGLNWIDVDDASRRGIALVTMPAANVEEVATHALALLLACARRLLELDGVVRGGGFEWPRATPFHRLRGRRLGLLAFGNIPCRLAKMVAPLGLLVSAYDPFVSREAMEALGVEPAGVEALLRSSDLLSVHLPSRPETRGFLDERRLDLLPAGAIVVVTSRGDVYDLDALVRGLKGGRIAAAGLDVFPEEPLPSRHPLLDLGNVVLTPHVAGYSEEAILDQHEAAAAAVRAVARGEIPETTVNLAEPS
jgi:D-3-phosphoglycerate dehydrogenase / 2-oxoglutarate reductase